METDVHIRGLLLLLWDSMAISDNARRDADVGTSARGVEKGYSQ